MNRRLLAVILIALILPGTILLSQPSNDSPCTSSLLNTTNECQFTKYTTLNATDSGLPLNQCDGYSGGDVWFKLVVPYSGRVTISISSDATQQFPNNNGWAYRPGLAVYLGSCESPIYDTCWIDLVPFSPPDKPSIALSGLTAGDTLFLRVWEYANNDNGDFEICVHDPDISIPGDIFIPQGFSPNMDGYNDMFEITGINNYPDNSISIYNIWGNEVFQMKQYNNSWDGTSKERVLPNGTYYYILRLNSTTILKNYIYLRRE